MAETTTGRIERELMDGPHIAGSRISVRTIHDRDEGSRLDPWAIADRSTGRSSYPDDGGDPKRPEARTFIATHTFD